MGGGHSRNDLGPYSDGCNFFGVIPYLMKSPIILTIKKKKKHETNRTISLYQNSWLRDCIFARATFYCFI